MYLMVIEELASSVPDAGVQSVATILVEKMNLLSQKRIIGQTNFNLFAENKQDHLTGPIADVEKALAFWFSALLRMVVIHSPAFTVSAPDPKLNNLTEQTRLLVSIICISLSCHLRDSLRLFPTRDYFPRAMSSMDCVPCIGLLMQTYALDVAASPIDIFPDEARHQCARFLKEKCPHFIKFQNDSWVAYLLGPIPDSPSCFALQPMSLPSPNPSSSTPTQTPSANAPVGSQQPATSTGISTVPPEGPNTIGKRFRLQNRGWVIGGYPLRPWELLEDAAPIMGVNDTAVSLRYFDTRRVRA